VPVQGSAPPVPVQGSAPPVPVQGSAPPVPSTNTYKDHKRDGIAFCGQFMASNPGLATFKHIIDASTKKDDLADCFLQGIYFLRQKNIISYNETLQVSVV